MAQEEESPVLSGEPVIPNYTRWSQVNLAIHRLASGYDPEHPVFGLGPSLVVAGEYDVKKKDGVHHFARVLFSNSTGKPRKGELELSYLADQSPDGHVTLAGGWFPRSKESW